VIDFITPWIASHEAVVLIGPKGVGKDIILQETFFPQGVVVSIFCCPDTNVSDVIAKIKSFCSFTTTSSGKAMRASNGAKLIIYFRNLEVLKADQWNSVSVIAFLTALLSQGGFYDAASLEWISLENFLILGTCISIDSLDLRLLNRVHVCEVSLPPVQEMQQIIPSLVGDRQAAWKTEFAKFFSKIMQELTGDQETDSGFLSSSLPSRGLDVFRVCREIMRLLSRYEVVDEKIMLLETRRVLINYYEDLFEDKNHLTTRRRSKGNHENVDSNLPEFFSGQHESISSNQVDGRIIFSHASGFGCKISQSTPSLFKEWTKKTIDRWVNETEALLPSPVGLIPETLAVFADSSIFLSDSTPGITVTLMSGSSASGRKLALKVLAHEFAYDIIWFPRSKLSEKHVVNEFKNFADSSSDSSGNKNNDEQDKRILILLEDLHFEGMPFLLKTLYTFYQEERTSASGSVIRVAIMKNCLSPSDDLILSLRVASVRKLSSWSEDSLVKLPLLMDPVISNNSTSIDSDFAVKFLHIFRMFPIFRRDNRRFLSLVSTFHTLFQDKKVDTENHRKEFLDKISKLETTRKEIEKLKSEAAKQRQDLDKKRKEADEALGLITSSMTSSEDQKIELQVIKSRTESETAKLKVRKEEIDKELASIEPTLLAAKAAVGGIKSEALSEIRSLRAPPEVIRDILEGVLRLMGVNDTSWISMKSFLGRRGIKEEIINFDARKISPEMSSKVEELLKKKPMSFDEKTAKRASAAAAPLAAWVLANLSFATVLQKIKPLEDEQNKLESGLRSAQSRMKSLSNQLEGVEDQVGHLRNRLNQVTLEAAQTEVNLKSTAQTLAQSEGLVQELSGEYDHWKTQLRELDSQLKFLSIRCLISSALVVLMGRLDSDKSSSQASRRKSLQRQDRAPSPSSSSFFTSTSAVNRSRKRNQGEQQDEETGDVDDDDVLVGNMKEDEEEITRQETTRKGTTCEQRNKLIREICQDLETEYFDVADFLGYSSEQEVFLRLKTPFLSKLMVDTGEQVALHLTASSSNGIPNKSSSQSSSIEVTSLQNRDWIRVVELSLRFGRKIILHSFDHLDLSLIPLIKQHFYGSEGSRSWTFVGEKRIDLNQNFALYFTTKNRNIFLMDQRRYRLEMTSRGGDASLESSKSLFNVIDFSSDAS